MLRQYARYFIGPAFEDRFAEGLLGLERDWTGPVLKNEGIDKTHDLFRALERDASPAVKLNWRFQLALYRADYDAYVRTRLRHETDLESAARARLRAAKEIGSRRAMNEAETLLDQAAREPAGAALRAWIFERAEGLFQSIRLQLSVSRYQAIAVERGANLDTIDTPLTEAGWLKKRFAAIRKLPKEADRLACLDAALNRVAPGPGGFYDDLGDPANSPHLVRGPAGSKTQDSIGRR